MGKVTRCLLAALLVVAAVVWFRVNGPVARVELDPEQFYPDVNRRNNSWTGQ